MKTMIYKKALNPKKRIKALSISSNTEDKDCRTHVRKSFVYKVDLCEETSPKAKPPQIFIHKETDTKKSIELFNFRVKGFFFIKHEKQQLKVRFQHTLNITIHWKKKIFSPKKSVVLTK